jgi:hypothetical protein
MLKLTHTHGETRKRQRRDKQQVNGETRGRTQNGEEEWAWGVPRVWAVGGGFREGHVGGYSRWAGIGGGRVWERVGGGRVRLDGGMGGFGGCIGSGRVVGGLVQGRFRWGKGMGGFREGACG